MERPATQAHAVLRHDARRVRVAAGGTIGRLGVADLRIADPRVSELHAMVSLRGRELHLLSLRGSLFADGATTDDVLLSEGLVVRLAPGVALHVDAVEVPQAVLAVLTPHGDVRELCAAVYSVHDGELVDRFIPQAEGHLWSAADGWWARSGVAQPVPMALGLVVAGHQVIEVPTDRVATATTMAQSPPLRILLRTETVHILRPRTETAVINGQPGRILSEVARMTGPARWEAVAQEIWPAVRNPLQLRELWDRCTRRLRNRLRECGIRDSLIQSDGCGNVELVRHPGDQLVDEG